MGGGVEREMAAGGETAEPDTVRIETPFRRASADHSHRAPGIGAGEVPIPMAILQDEDDQAFLGEAARDAPALVFDHDRIVAPAGSDHERGAVGPAGRRQEAVQCGHGREAHGASRRLTRPLLRELGGRQAPGFGARGNAGPESQLACVGRCAAFGGLKNAAEKGERHGAADRQRKAGSLHGAVGVPGAAYRTEWSPFTGNSMARAAE